MDAPDMGVTENAVLLLGYIGGAITRDTTYELVDVQPAEGTQTIRNAANGNLYRVSVIQIEGQA